MGSAVFGLFIITLLLVSCCNSLPFWKVFCNQAPAFRGRLDPIINPGTQSGHVHKVWGASNFGPGALPSNTTDIDMYNQITNSACTDCSITIDLSNYWIPDLYYQFPNGSLTIVPNGGLTVYYLSRGGTGNQTTPQITAFPKGLRMLAGNPYRRTFNSSSVADRAISYSCLSTSDNPGPSNEPNNFPTDVYQCGNGLRAQVWFPMCWDGVHLDSPNHVSHMSYPIQAPDGGDCPSTHPVRVPGLFYEVLFDVNNATWPHGVGIGNPFRWSCGDSTGYGLHGDFLNGWSPSIMAQAIADPTCDSSNSNTDDGNNVKACNALAPYVVTPSSTCTVAPIPGFVEDIGLGHAITRLPGCNNITSFNATAAPCPAPAGQPGVAPGTYRGYLKNVATGQYLNVVDNSTGLSLYNSTANTTRQIFVLNPFGNGTYSWYSERTLYYIGTIPSGAYFINNKWSVSTWESWQVNGTVSAGLTIWSVVTTKYVSVANGSVSAAGASIGPSSQWILETPVILPGNTTFTGLNYTTSPFN